jgi:PadR family transcriptional regulator, regulatory protein PadR
MLTSHISLVILPGMARDPSSSKLSILQGTLDLMVLQTLASMGTLHGYGLARRIEQRSGDEVLLNQGTIYPSLLRLQQRRWISAKWAVSETGRRARYYTITAAGRGQLTIETSKWERLAAAMRRLLAPIEGGAE